MSAKLRDEFNTERLKVLAKVETFDNSDEAVLVIETEEIIIKNHIELTFAYSF